MNSLLQHHAGDSEIERIASVLDDLPAVLWQAKGEPGTPAFRMEYVSKFAQVLLGYPVERWLDEPDFWIQIVHPEDRDQVVEEMRGVYGGGRGSAKEFRWRAADGRFLWAEAQSTALNDGRGQPCGLRGVLLDATARKTAELESRENEARFRSVFDANLLPVCRWHHDGRVVDANDSYLALVGYTRNELRAGKVNWRTMTPPEYAEVDRRAIEEITLTGKCTPFSKEYQVKSGRRVPVLVGLVPLPGEVDCTLGYVLDMSHLHQAQAASLRAKDLQTAVLHSLQEQVAIIDQDGTILEVNEAWRHQAQEGGINPDFRWEGYSYLMACRPQATSDDGSTNTACSGIEAVLRGTKTFYKEEYCCQTPFKTLWFEMTVVPLRRSGGGAIISHSDITTRKEAEAAVQSMREQLAHATRVHVLSELSGALGHELNQPLAAILSSAQAAERYLAWGTDVTRELHELLAAIVVQSVRGGEIISRVLAMHKKRDSTFEPLSINEVTLEMLRLLKSDLVTRNIGVLTDLAVDLPLICGDRVQLQQVLLNLILNGCDAMDANEISERVLMIQTHAMAGGGIELSVADRGGGIDEKLLPHVCSPFVTTKAGGLGLGLSICRTIAEAHFGNIHIANNAEQGVTVKLCLPKHRSINF